MQGVDSVYETDLFDGLPRATRAPGGIVADHVRSSLWLLEDGVRPSNTDQGYVLRRLIRRAIRQCRELGIELRDVVSRRGAAGRGAPRSPGTLRRGLKEVRRLSDPDGRDVFRLFETYGFPPELTVEELGGLTGWEEEFDARRRGAPRALPRRRRAALQP